MATKEPHEPPGRLRTALGRLFRRQQDVEQPAASNITHGAPSQPAVQQQSPITPTSQPATAPRPHAMPTPVWLYHQLNQPPITLTPRQQQQQQQLLMEQQVLMEQQLLMEQQQAQQHPWMQLPSTQHAALAMMQQSWDWQFWAQQHHDHQQAAHQEADAMQPQDTLKRQMHQQQQQEHDAMAKVNMWQDALHSHQMMLAQRQQQLYAEGQSQGSQESSLQQLFWQQQQVQQQHEQQQLQQLQQRQMQLQTTPPGGAHKHTPDSYQRLLMYQSQIFGLPIPQHLLPLHDPSAPPPTPALPEPWQATEPLEPADSALDLVYMPAMTSYLDRWHVDRYGDFVEPPKPMQLPPRDAIQHAAMLQAAMQATTWHNPVYEPELWFSPPLPPAPSPPPSAPRTPRPSLPGKVTASVQNMLGYLTHLGKKNTDRTQPGAEGTMGTQGAMQPTGPLHPTLAALR